MKAPPPVLPPSGSAEEIRGLIVQLRATERRLLDLTGGEVDAVVDGEGRTFLLQRAQEQLRLDDAVKQTALLGTDRRERILSTALSAMTDFAQIFDREGKLLFVNRPLLELWGLPLEAVVGRNFHDLGFPDELAAKLLGQVQRVLATGESITDEVVYSSPEGVQGRYEYIFSAAFAADGTVDFVVGSTRDVTERRRLEEQLRQTQKMEAIGTLAGGIAHDFNNILAAINGHTELALVIPDGNPAIRAHLESVAQAARRATDLVRQILTFSRQQPLERRPLQLVPVVAETLKLLRATIPSSIEFETVLPSENLTVLADATQIHQVLMNLGTNAWHAMKEGSGRLTVTLERCVIDAAHAAVQSGIRPGVYARVCVADTGQGMSPATLQRIFDPFFTTKAPGEGTGLGLAVVRGIMDSHEGAITVTSAPGAGTAFYLYFPAQADAAPPVGADAAPTPRGRGERILLVDDEEMLARLGQQTLAELGYEAEIATDPTVALAAFRCDPHRLALVITDQTMPRMTGLALAGELLRIRPDLPIILTTGYNQLLNPARIQAEGLRQVLLKPFTMDQLAAAVWAALAAPSPVGGPSDPLEPVPAAAVPAAAVALAADAATA
jgi:PAS domain S-box-containing protein